MKKAICLAVAAALLLAALAGCAETDTAKKELPQTIAQADWADAKEYVELSTGITMAYVEMGDPAGDAVILQHGMTDNSRSWSLAAPYFAAAGYHVYLPELRGMGDSDAPDGYYTPITYATDLNAFCDAMSIESAVVVGHSLGSYTAQCFALMFPARCEKLVLVSSLPLTGLQNDTLTAVYQNYIAPLPEDGHPSDAFMDVWYDTALHEAQFADEFELLLENMKREAQALSKQAWKNITLGLMAADLTGLYPLLDRDIPVLVLHGDADTMAETAYQAELCELFAVDESSYVNYAGVGHNIQYDIPEKCATDILTWLATGALPA